MSKRQAILDALKTCDDPELGINVVDLGLIYDIKEEGATVTVIMTLTTPACPLLPYFRQEIERKTREASGCESVVIDLTFDPPWSPAKMSSAAKTQLKMMR